MHQTCLPKTQGLYGKPMVRHLLSLNSIGNLKISTHWLLKSASYTKSIISHISLPVTPIVVAYIVILNVNHVYICMDSSLKVTLDLYSTTHA